MINQPQTEGSVKVQSCEHLFTCSEHQLHSVINRAAKLHVVFNSRSEIRLKPLILSILGRLQLHCKAVFLDRVEESFSGTEPSVGPNVCAPHAAAAPPTPAADHVVEELVGDANSHHHHAKECVFPLILYVVSATGRLARSVQKELFQQCRKLAGRVIVIICNHGDAQEQIETASLFPSAHRILQFAELNGMLLMKNLYTSASLAQLAEELKSYRFKGGPIRSTPPQQGSTVWACRDKVWALATVQELKQTDEASKSRRPLCHTCSAIRFGQRGRDSRSLASPVSGSDDSCIDIDCEPDHEQQPRLGRSYPHTTMRYIPSDNDGDDDDDDDDDDDGVVENESGVDVATAHKFQKPVCSSDGVMVEILNEEFVVFGCDYHSLCDEEEALLALKVGVVGLARHEIVAMGLLIAATLCAVLLWCFGILTF